MPKTIPMSTIFRHAADKYLAVASRASRYQDKETYSCLAVRSACFELLNDDLSFHRDVFKFMNSAGLNTNSIHQFDRVADNSRDRQGARFMWLEMLAVVADDEGLTVEVCR